MWIPIVNEELAIKPKADSFIAHYAKCVRLTELSFDLTGPANAEAIGRNAEPRTAGAPILRNRFGPRAGESGEIGVEKILGRKPAAGERETRLQLAQR